MLAHYALLFALVGQMPGYERVELGPKALGRGLLVNESRLVLEGWIVEPGSNGAWLEGVSVSCEKATKRCNYVAVQIGAGRLDLFAFDAVVVTWAKAKIVVRRRGLCLDEYWTVDRGSTSAKYEKVAIPPNARDDDCTVEMLGSQAGFLGTISQARNPPPK